MPDRRELQLDMNPEQMKDILFRGNPGSNKVFEDIAEWLPEIDPHIQPGIHAIGFLAQYINNLLLYDDKLWRLYNDICERDLDKTAAILRGGHLGIRWETVHAALNPVSDKDRMDVDDVVRFVQSSVQGFKQIVPITPGYKGPQGNLKRNDQQ